VNLQGLRPGDVVEIDGPAAKGGEAAHAAKRFYAQVRDVRPAAGGGELVVRRSAADPTFTVRARLVVDKFYRAGSRGSRSRKLDEEAVPA
jgi:hypothetical protein